MGRNTFTKEEIDQIRNLLRQKVRADKNTQKSIRANIRNIGFNISDFDTSYSGFTEIDFQALIRNGIIKITESQSNFNSKSTKSSISSPAKNLKSKKDNDENYIIDLCDQLLKQKAIRQQTFSFLVGDPNKKGKCKKLPVDAFYPSLNLVIEYFEKQHTEAVNFFDKKDKLTVSGVDRGTQREIYFQRRFDVFPKNGINYLVIDFSSFSHKSNKRLVRNIEKDMKVLEKILAPYISTNNA